MTPPLIYPEDPNNEEDNPREYLSIPLSVNPTPLPGPPNENPTEEPPLEPNYNALSEPFAPTREGYMVHLSPKDIVICHKGSDPPRFVTL